MRHELSFFRDEIRNGFYIPTAIKQSWASQLDVLAEIDRICTRHDITYFADWGSFLGAIRHGGIVPWDDDIDIFMKRDDYTRFREVADAELPEDYVIHDYERQKDHWLFLSRVVNSPKIRFDVDYLNTHYNFHWLSGVDIFVKDYLYRDPQKEKERCKEVLLILAVAESVISGDYNPASLKAHLNEFSKKYSYTFPKGDPGRDLAVSLYRLAELQMALVPESESDRICQLFPWGLKGNQGEPKELYNAITRLPFEDTTIPVPSMYNETLRSRYGNYMEIRKGAAAHDYPSFEAQRRLFEKESGATLPRFSFDKSMLQRPEPDKSGSIKLLAKECLEGLFSLVEKASQALETGITDDLEQALNDAQQLAVDLGTTIEYVRGESDPHTKAVVSILEAFCEGIYSLYQHVLTEGGSSSDRAGSFSDSSPASDINRADVISKALSSVRSCLENLTTALEQHIITRDEVLFLPVGPKEWQTMHPLYEEFSSNPDTDVSVIHLPLMFKDYFGNITMTEEEILSEEKKNIYPDGIVTGHFADYDLALHCPKKIVIQNPYDETNPLLTVPKAYYAKELQRYTDELIYVPIGATAEFTENDATDQANLNYYVTAPGVILADKVYVQSENIRTQYINALSSFAGTDTRDHWVKKIAPKPELFRLGAAFNSSGRKELLFCVASYERDEHRELFEQAISERIDIMTQNPENIHVTICDYPAGSLDPFVQKIAESKSISIIPCDLESPDAFVSKFDAYYGSASPIAPYFVAQKKPVMIADLGV